MCRGDRIYDLEGVLELFLVSLHTYLVVDVLGGCFSLFPFFSKAFIGFCYRWGESTEQLSRIFI